MDDGPFCVEFYKFPAPDRYMPNNPGLLSPANVVTHLSVAVKYWLKCDAWK